MGELDEYLKFTDTTAVYPKPTPLGEILYLALGLAGEGGEAANVCKKLLRDGMSDKLIEAMKDELGDVLWYWVRMCQALGYSPAEIIEGNMAKLNRRKETGEIQGHNRSEHGQK